MKKIISTLLLVFTFAVFSSYSATRIEDTDAGTISYNGALKSYSTADNGTAINLSNSSGQQIVWNYNSSSAGAQTITLRYTRKSTMNSTVTMIVNGSSSTLALSVTSSNAFTTSTFSANLLSGNNTVILQTNAGGESADIDWIEFSGGTATTNFSLSTSVSGQGSVSPSSGTFASGTVVSLSATPASGWQFSGWSGGASGTSNPVSITMNSNISVTATFTQVTSSSTITIQEGATGFCNVDGSVDNNNSGFTGSGFANTDNSTGQGVNWKVNFASAGTYTFLFRYASSSDRPGNLMINGSTVSSNVNFPSTGSWTTWTTVSTAASVSAGTYDVRLQATTASGLANIDYMQITGSNPSAAACTTTPSTFTVSTSVSGSGSVSGAGTYNAGATATLTATPSSGYQFNGWSGGASGTSNPLSLTVNSNISVTANFSQVSNPTVNFAMFGYATVNANGYNGTTGGAGGSVTTVSNLVDLLNWAANRENNTTPAILYISGKISASSTTVVTVKHGANVSIFGLGSTAELENIGLNIWDYHNVIVRNLKIHEVFYPEDALTIDACNHVWVDHCELYSIIGGNVGVDTYDGLLDIKRGSKYVTVSWCYLHDHMKTMLIGHTDNTSQQATDSEMRITLHHNYHHNTDGRNPSVRFGAVHMYNNYFNTIGDYGLAARDGAHLLVENCHYNNVELSMSTDKFPVSGLPNGYICQSGNLFTGSTGSPVISQTDCGWWNLPYSYSLDPASSVSSIVPANVGVGKLSNPASFTVVKSAEQAGQVLSNPSMSSVKVYPLPFNGSATIAVDLAVSSEIHLSVFDMTGKKMNEEVYTNLQEGLNQITYTNNMLKSGMYIMKIQSGNYVHSRMIIVE